MFQNEATSARETLSESGSTTPRLQPPGPHLSAVTLLSLCRYFALGFSGPKWEAEDIKRQLTTFLQEELKLSLSEEKTLITHARSDDREIPWIRNDHPAKRYQTMSGKEREDTTLC